MDVLMPQLGETVAEGTVAAWHKQVGDHVEADEILLDVETDKVSMEIPAPTAGVLAKILVEAGQTVEVGTVLAIVQAEGESVDASAGNGADASANAQSGAGAQEAAAASKAQEAGAQASAGAKAGAADTSPAAAPSSAGKAGADRSQASGAAAPRDADRRLSPAVRRLAAEHDLALSQIEGSGRNGRITRRDVLQYLESAPASRSAAAQASQRSASAHASAASASTSSTGRASQPAAARAPAAPLEAGVVPFNRIRKLTAEHMVRSKATSPHVLQAVEVDFSNVDRVRKSVREAWRGRRGYSLTYLPFIAHAVCQALREFPNANGSIEGDALVLHDHVNLAIAVDLGPDGLVAPVIKSAEALSVAQMAEAIQDVAGRARQGRLRPDDLSGGTYTLSNSGTFGTLITAPIINQPQVAILSTDGVRKKPVVIEHPDGDSIAIRPIGILAQSFDHRAIDGAYSAAFLDRVRKILERDQWSIEV